MVDNVKVNYQSDEGSDESGTKYVLNHLVDTPSDEKHIPMPRIEKDISFNRYCPHCNLNFDDKEEYEHHNIEMHAQKKTLTCEYCQTVFRRQDHLKRHIHSLHLSQKYYVCPVCEKDCKRQDAMLKHIKNKHSSEKEIFHCRECPFKCNKMTILEKHEYTHLLKDRHTCPHCNTSFKRRDHMVRHIKSQHLNELVVCPICQQTYKRRDHVVRHVREKHKMGYLNGKLVKSEDII
ncbi:unnamed protein product [Parnassius apollo]|uniref:(apollo) hypothetical protein n=1 Tax=Parnassius apollo TaxID=110799 RepID=A0A8S3XL46_PARAO|nr:unnamed protein product [Parnassius apollo]